MRPRHRDDQGPWSLPVRADDGHAGDMDIHDDPRPDTPANAPIDRAEISPSEAPSTPARPIVVGVDGSQPSLAALRFAVDEARLRGAPVHALCAWQYPQAYAGIGSGWVADVGNYDYQGGAATLVDEAVAALADQRAGVDIIPVIEEGHPAVLLVRAAATADLLVVGSRGHGGFTGMLLGSVGQHCVHHALCPVVVVPAARHGAR